MKKLNQKGFSLVELLAVVSIMAILTGVGISAYTRYSERAKKDGYTILAQSAISAAEEYIMDHPTTTEVNFDVLVKQNYLESSADPGAKGEICSGTVRITPQPTEEGQLASNKYIVDVCCAGENYEYEDNGRRVVTGICHAEFQQEKYIEQNPTTNCVSGTTKTKNINIYTMNYLDKVCSKNASGNYGSCKDSQGNYPCRRYDYHLRKCVCTYNKNNNKFCSSAISASGSDNHTMKIRYFNNANGISACNSDDPGSFNSYVTKVCTYGTYASGSDVMTFHGYQFFKEKSVGYTDFRPEGTWFHDPITGITLEDRVPRKDKEDGTIDYEQGCRDTCIRFTEYLSGKVS